MRKISILLITLIIVSILCSSVVLAANEVTIKFWGGWTGPDRLGMQKIAKSFEKENPNIKVEFFTAPWTELFTKFGVSYGTSSAPDLLAMHVQDISQFVARNMLLPVGDTLKEEKISVNDFPKPVWEGQFVNGVQYGIPLDYHPMAVYKNAELFRKAGLDPEATFNSKEEFIDACKKLTVKDSNGNIVQYGIAIGADHPHTMRYWYGLLFQAGGQFLNKDLSKAVFASAEGTKALQFLYDLVYTYKVAPMHESDIHKDFFAGRVAMLIEGPWWVPGMLEQKNIEVTVVPFPKIFNQLGVWSGSHTLTIPKQNNKEKLSAAIKLMDYIVEHSIEWGEAGQIPASLSVINSDEYKKLPGYKYFKSFIDQSEFIHYEPLIEENAIFGSDNQMSPILNAIYGVIIGEKEPAEALIQAAKEVDDILSR